MSGETEQNISAWTIDSLHSHFVVVLAEKDTRYEQRFHDQEKAILAALIASEKAILKAESATERRFDSVNEFRQTLSDQAAQFITRSEAESNNLRNTERIQDLTDRLNKSEGRGNGYNASWLYFLGAIAALGTIVSLYLALRT